MEVRSVEQKLIVITSSLKFMWPLREKNIEKSVSTFTFSKPLVIIIKVQVFILGEIFDGIHAEIFIKIKILPLDIAAILYS